MLLRSCCGRFCCPLLEVQAKTSVGTTLRWSSILRYSPNVFLNKKVLERYKNLKTPSNKYQATYLWIDGTTENIRLKDRILDKVVKCPNELPEWSYDGSSCYQAQGENSDIIIKPRRIYRDPFKPGKKDILVMCDTYNSEGKPLASNNRIKAEEAFDKVEDQEPWFGIEQEYTLLDTDGHPFGWPKTGFPAPQGPYYASVGADRCYCRDLAEAHAIACLYAGIDFAGTNAEVMPSSWEYQIGPTEGIKVCDDLWISRYILHRIAEELGVVVTLDPKPVPNWNGAGAHTNFSTKSMREDGGFKKIVEAVEKLSKRHKEHIAVYDPKGGQDNIRRLVGRLETSSIDKFTWGVANRNVSVRVSRLVKEADKGFLEDRRPSSNMDPYAVCNAIVRTCCLNE